MKKLFQNKIAMFMLLKYTEIGIPESMEKILPDIMMWPDDISEKIWKELSKNAPGTPKDGDDNLSYAMNPYCLRYDTGEITGTFENWDFQVVLDCKECYFDKVHGKCGIDKNSLWARIMKEKNVYFDKYMYCDYIQSINNYFEE